MRRIMMLIAVCAVIAFRGISFAADTGTGLVLHYTFDEGTGNTVHDQSGRGNDGKIYGAEWVKSGKGYGLKFNGTNTYVDCGNGASLNITEAITIEAWVKWDGKGAAGQYLVAKEFKDRIIPYGFRIQKETGELYFVTYSSGAANGAEKGFLSTLGRAVNAGRYTHAAVTYNKGAVHLYIDGRDAGTGNLTGTGNAVASSLFSNSPARLLIGTYERTGSFFNGTIDEVKIYNRALSKEEIAASYRSGARRVGAEVSDDIGLAPRTPPQRGKLVVDVDLSKVTMPADGFLLVNLYDPEQKEVRTTRKRLSKDSRSLEVAFPGAGLKSGLYEIKATLLDQKELPIGQGSVKKVALLGMTHAVVTDSNARMLNNLVAELANTSDLPAKPYQEVAFTNPRQGWVFISSQARLKDTASVSIAIDAEKEAAVIVLRSGDPETKETMRFVDAGNHRLRIWSEAGGSALPVVSRLVIRAVPQLVYSAFRTSAPVGLSKVYDLKFLEKNVFPNVNVIIGGEDDEDEPLRKEWYERGIKCLDCLNIPTISKPNDLPKPITAEYMYDWCTKSKGFQKPYLSGLLGDEFITAEPEENFRAYTAAIKTIAANPAFKDRAFYPYVQWGLLASTRNAVKEFWNTVFTVGYRVDSECYISEMKSEKEMRNYLDKDIRKLYYLYGENTPGLNEHMIHTVGYRSAPPDTLNCDPNVDFKTHLDLQFQLLATAPEFFGLYGVELYTAHYVDEETMRWAWQLVRHYCIEGNTTLLSDRYGYKYDLKHILNADFDQGLQAWTVDSAQEGSIMAPRRLPGDKQWAGLVEGRAAPNPADYGSNFLWTKRCANKPNKVSQTIKDLALGKLYSVKMITADFQDWCQNKSEAKPLTTSIQIDGVEMIPAKGYVKVMQQNRFAMDFGPFTNARPGFNYHFLLFRAKATTAKLTISDWTDENTPGGPIGQELITNFIEVQPYFEE